MNKIFETLSKLEKVDKVIADFQRELDELPKELKLTEKEFLEIQDSYNKLKAELEELTSLKKEKDQQLQEKKEFVKKSESKLYLIKTYKEFNAAQKEISEAKNEIKQLEDEIIELIEKIEGKEKEFKEIEEKFKEVSSKYEKMKEEVATKESEIKGKIDEENKIREKFVKDLDNETLAKYNLIRSRRNGIAIVEINSNTCSGCFMNLPPQLIIEIRKKNKIIQCPSCQRILIWNEDN